MIEVTKMKRVLRCKRKRWLKKNKNTKLRIKSTTEICEFLFRSLSLSLCRNQMAIERKTKRIEFVTSQENFEKPQSKYAFRVLKSVSRKWVTTFSSCSNMMKDR